MKSKKTMKAEMIANAEDAMKGREMTRTKLSTALGVPTRTATTAVGLGLPAKRGIKSKQLTAAHDQLATRDEVADIIRDELMSQMESGNFWSELQEILSQGKAPKHEAQAAPPAKRKKNNTTVSQRGQLI